MANELVIKTDAFKVLSVEDSVAKYSPELSDNDIKGFVWYNRTLGIPMTGWEKWFITNSNKNVVTALEDIDYLNQFHEVIGRFQKGDEVGKVTKFETTYDRTTYVAVRRFDNSLCLVDKSKLNIDNKYEVATKDLEALVKSKSLMYLNGMFLPLHVYSNTDYDTLKKSLEDDKEYMIAQFGKDVYEYHESIISGYVSMRVDHPIKDKRYKLNPFGELARETMTIPLNETIEKSVSSAFIAYIFTLKNSDFELVSKDVFLDRIIRNNDRITKGYGSSEEEKKAAQDAKEKEISDAKLECERLFSDYLTNVLDSDTVKILNKKINETYNRSIIVNTTKIPVGFKHSNMLKTSLFELKPVQVDAFKFAISRNNYCLALNVGYGKGHLLTSKLLSPKGYVTMGDVKIGDDVIGKNGLPTKIIGVFPLGKVQCYKVTFSDGSFAQVSDEHLWNVQTFEDRNKHSKHYGQWRTLETKEIIKDFKNKRGDCKYSIPMTSPVEFEKQDTPIHPYLLGVLLGDGGLTNNAVKISNREEDILEKIKTILPKSLELIGGYNDGTDWRVTNKIKGGSNEILNSIKDLGLSGKKSNNKFIPEIYKINSAEVRLEVLRGLLDTDGYITNPSKINERNGNSIIFTTVSKQLCDDVVFLVQSFGGTCILNEKVPHFTYNGERKEGQLAYNITIRLSTDIIPVSSKKQLAKYKPKTKYQPVRFIKSIEDIGFQEAQCIKVDAVDELYLCEQFVVTHNTSVQISIMSYLLGTGTITKPLMIVPKPVMKNWQKELFGFWSKGNLTSFEPVEGWERNYGIMTDCGFEYFNIQNLNQSIVKKADEIKKINKGIILGSYEALQKMYIGDYDTRMFVIEQWKELLEQANNGDENDRDTSKKISSLIAKLNKVDKSAEIDIMKLGLDSIYFDEAHRLKNLFSGVSADKTNRIKSGFKGNPSDRSLRAFYITQYMQKIKGRIGFLTATPFSNTPLEVYTMLIFLNYAELVKNNVYKIVSFVEQFFNETTEYKVNQNNKIVSETVMKSYKNKPILYKILSNTFIYRQDPIRAGIKRPCIIRYPNKDIKLMLNQSPLQELQRDVLVGKNVNYDEFLMKYPETEPYLQDFREKWASTQQTTTKLGLSGKILSASKSSALSPFCNSPLRLDFVTDQEWKELYQFSPKIRFTIDSIKLMMDYQLIKGEKLSSFLIYVGIGVNLLEPFKQALNEILGLKTNLKIEIDEDDDETKAKKTKITYDEVEIIEGSADTDKEADRRERVTDLFNKGMVKVILGTDTIKEGLNLQVNSATLFILTPTWNSTDIKQLEGRIHRQGNKYGYARVITPLVTRTLDSFIYQKYEEKEARLSDIWEDDGLSTTGSLDVQIAPSKQKELILDDAREIAKIRSEMMERKETNEYDKIKDEYESLRTAIQTSNRYKFFVDYFSSRLPKVKQVIEENKAALKLLLESINSESDAYIRSRKERIKTLIDYYEDLDVKTLKALEGNEIIDLINIFNGEFRRRAYNLNIDYNDEDKFERLCTKVGIENPSNLTKEDIFERIGISRLSKNPYRRDSAESIYDLSAIYSQCFFAEKYILNPEGLSLISSQEELNGALQKYRQKVEDRLTALRANFDVTVSYSSIKIKAREEFVKTLEREARIELDEENKLSKNDAVLAEYFTEKTNVQLDYKIGDIDTKTCLIPYSNVNVPKIVGTTSIINDEPLPTKIDVVPEPKTIITEPTKNLSSSSLNTIGDAFFKEHPEKIIGEMSISDFRNMIIVSGTKDDVIAYFKNVFAKSSNEPKFSTDLKAGDRFNVYSNGELTNNIALIERFDEKFENNGIAWVRIEGTEILQDFEIKIIDNLIRQGLWKLIDDSQPTKEEPILNFKVGDKFEGSDNSAHPNAIYEIDHIDVGFDTNNIVWVRVSTTNKLEPFKYRTINKLIDEDSWVLIKDTKPNVPEPTVKIEPLKTKKTKTKASKKNEVVEEPTVEDIQKAIDVLQMLANVGDEDAIRAIETLSLLI